MTEPLGALQLALSDRYRLETVSIGGGTPTALAPGGGYADLVWATDERLQVVDGDGSELRSFDLANGSVTSSKIQPCLLPSPMPDGTQLLCGGGGPKLAPLVNEADSAKPWELLWTHVGAADSARVLGTHFRSIDQRYLVYLSMHGGLLAAPVDAKHRVGRSVRLVDGIARREYTGAGAYDVSRSGTLVYAEGINRAAGNLVRINEHSVDTLEVGHAAFRLFSPSPDGTRLAAVVTVMDGEELRVYNLRTGGQAVRAIKGATLPVWNTRGDRLAYGSNGTLFAGSADQSTAPEPLCSSPSGGVIEACAWGPDDRVIIGDWDRRRILALNLRSTPPVVEELARDGEVPSLSPRWL